MALVLVHCHFYVNHLLSVFSIDVASVSQSSNSMDIYF
jgi:hypothetical protein